MNRTVVLDDMDWSYVLDALAGRAEEIEKSEFMRTGGGYASLGKQRAVEQFRRIKAEIKRQAFPR